MKKQLLLGVMLFAFIFPPGIAEAKDTPLKDELEDRKKAIKIATTQTKPTFVGLKAFIFS